jgi:hypothetical protein
VLLNAETHSICVSEANVEVAQETECMFGNLLNKCTLEKLKNQDPPPPTNFSRCRSVHKYQ